MSPRPFEIGPALLFCPADREDRYEKASARADAVILDLEDAVSRARRPSAREALRRTPLDPARTIVRVNAADTDDMADDVRAALESGYDTLMLAKTASADDVSAVVAESAELSVIALCETAAGVIAAEQIARHPNVIGLMWGAEDLVASIGGTSSRRPDGTYRDVAVLARSTVLLSAAAAGIAAIDTVHVEIGDVSGLAGEAEDAAAVGFAATACIHPDQVQTIRDAYRPGARALSQANAVLEAARHADGVFTFDGRMVDEPVLAHARAIVRRDRR